MSIKDSTVINVVNYRTRILFSYPMGVTYRDTHDGGHLQTIYQYTKNVCFRGKTIFVSVATINQKRNALLCMRYYIRWSCALSEIVICHFNMWLAFSLYLTYRMCYVPVGVIFLSIIQCPFNTLGDIGPSDRFTRPVICLTHTSGSPFINMV